MTGVSLPVFVDTNLDTHLAMVISGDDTVADLKGKVIVEHLLCFPDIGEISISSVKVRRRSCFYHLSDNMCVKSAFNGIKGTWYVHMDAASTCLMKNQVSSKEGSPSRLESGRPVKPHPLEPQVSNILSSVEGHIQSGVLKASTNQNHIQPQPDSDTALLDHCEKSMSHDPLDGTAPIPDNLSLPEVGNIHIKNRQVSTISQFESIDRDREASIKPGEQDSHVEFGASASNFNERSDLEMPKMHNTVTERTGALEAHLPSHKNARHKDHGVGSEDLPSASFVSNVEDYSKKSKDLQVDNSLGDTLQPVSVAEKKRKRKKKEDGFEKPAALLPDASADVCNKEMSELGNTNSKKFSSRPLNDVCSSPQNHVERKSKKRSLNHQDGLDCEAPGKIGLSEVPLPPPGGPDDVISSKETVAPTDVDSFVAIGMDDTDCHRVEIEKGALGEVVAFGSKKAKKRKKHSTATAVLPSVEVVENLTRTIEPSLNVNVTPADATIGIHQIAESDDHITPSAAQGLCTSKTTIAGMDLDKINRDQMETKMDTSGKAVASEDKKAKKSRKRCINSSKSTSLPSAEEDGNATGDTTPLQMLTEASVNGSEKMQHDNVTLAGDNVGMSRNCEPTNRASLSAPQDASKLVDAETAYSLMVGLNENAGSKTEVKIDALMQTVASVDKKVKSRRHRGAMSRHPNPPSVEENSHTTGDVITSGYENVTTLGDDDVNIRQLDETGEESNQLSKSKELKSTHLDTTNSKNESQGLEEAEKHNETDASKLPEISKVMESGDVKDRRGKKLKKTKSTGTRSVADDTAHVSSGKDFNSEDHGVVTKEASIAFSRETSEKPQTEISNSRFQFLEKEENETRDEVNPFNTASASGVEETTDSRDENGRRKSKRAAASSASEPLTNQHDGGTVGLATIEKQNAMGEVLNLDTHQIGENKNEEIALPRKMKKAKSGKKNSKDLLSGSMLQGEKDTGIKAAGSEELLSDTSKSNLEGRRPKANTGDEVSVIESSINETNDIGVDLKKFSMSEEQQAVDPSEDLVSRETLKKSHRERTKKGGKKTQDASVNTVEIEGPFSINQQDKNEAPSKRNKSSKAKVHDASGNSSSAHVFAVEGSKEIDANRATSGGSTDLENTVYASRLGRHVSSPPNRYRVAVRKVASKKVGEVLNSSDLENSLLATSDSIFKHISSESSQDDGGVSDSDATTISHSNDSSTSAYSDAEREATYSKPSSAKKRLNMDSLGTGPGASSPWGGKNKQDECTDIDLSQSTATKNRSIGKVLRSSIAYKKAKVTLSQSRLNDSESQPDIIPDSQALDPS